MTTFAEMQQRVIGLTKRPELVAVTDLAIRTATLRAHQVDYFPQDQASIAANYTLPVDNQIFVEVTGLQTLIPLLRNFSWMQGEDLLTGIPVENFEYVEDYKNFWDEYKELKNSVFTRFGDTIRARAISPTGRFRLYYYVNPNVQAATYNSWIANLYPDELAMWAAGIVWARSGNMEQAKSTYELHVTPFKDILLSSHLTGKI